MRSSKTKPFILDSITYGGEKECYCTGEEINSELIADIKQGISEGKIYFILAFASGESEQQFRLEFSMGLQGKNWLELEITYTENENIEHIFTFCDENSMGERERRDFDNDTILKSSCCYDFGVAAEIFEKWALTGDLFPGLWWHQWDDGEDHFELTELL